MAWGGDPRRLVQPIRHLSLREGSRIRTVRLACIDAPETSQAPQGASARAALQALAPEGSALEVRIQTTDR